MEPPLWCVKYRPTNWSELIGQESAVSQLSGFVASNTCPNMILYGPPGTGKSIAAEIFSREYLGNAYSSNFKLLNIRDLRRVTIAQAKRSVQALAKLDRAERDDLDEYMSVVFREARTELKLKGHSRDPNRSQLLQAAIRLFASTITVTEDRVKILVLDESDALDNNMQQALRRTMEIYNEACRFILISPTLSGWSPAVISRSLVIRFPALSPTSLELLIKDVVAKEGVSIEDTALHAITREAGGDARNAINLLQITAAGTKTITEDDVYECSESTFTTKVRDAVSLALAGSFAQSRDKMKKLLALDGYNAREIIQEIQRDLLKRPIESPTMDQILDRVSEIDFRLTESRNSFIQLSALLASLGAIQSSEAA